jgi:lysophospholipase L1-like esterase
MKRSHRFLLSAVLSVFAAGILNAPLHAQPVRTLRWAAIGDVVSNTGWPARTGARLPADSVINYGYAGGTALRSGDSSYWTSGKLAQVFAYQPDIISIHLGSSDSKPLNWGDSANFERDYKALIDTLATLPTHPRIVVVYPTPVWKNEAAPQDPGLRRGSVIAGSIVAKLRKIAKDKGVDTLDLHTPMLARQTLFADSLTPSTAGNDTLGRHVFNGFIAQSIRIVCVGNSITFAVNTNGTIPVKETYSMRLNMLLGPRYWVWNGGKTGWWMQRATLPGSSSQYKSYVTDKTQMDSLFYYKPHYITVKLGTNDARQNFWIGSRFITDYQYFIDTVYNNMTPKPKFVLFKAIPAWRISGNWQFSNGGANTPELNGINGDIIRDSLAPAIDVIAASRPLAVKNVIDLYTPFLPYGPGSTPNLVTDGVHPTRVGQDTLARIVYRSLLPVVSAIKPAMAGKAAPAVPARAVRLVRTASGVARDAGLKTVDGKAAGRGVVAPGVYLKPSPTSSAPKQPADR